MASGHSAPNDSFAEIHSPPPPYNQLSVPIESTGKQRKIGHYGWNITQSCHGNENLPMSSQVLDTDDKIIDNRKVSPAQSDGNPLDKPREFHDRNFLIAFGLYLLLMVGVGIFALSTGTFYIMQSREGCSNPSYSFTDSLMSSGYPRHNFRRFQRDVKATTNMNLELKLNPDDSNPNYSALRQSLLFHNNMSNPVFTKKELKTYVMEVPMDILVSIFVSMTFIALGFSIVVTILLKQFAGPIVWGVIFLGISVFILFSGGLWIAYLITGELFLLILALAGTCVTIVLLLVIKVMKKRIQIVVPLFKEAGKAIQAVPFVVAQPVLTFLCLLLTTVISALLGFLLETSLVQNIYTGTCWKPGFASASRWLNIFAFYWVTQFFIGCQHMVVAGVITKWFFTRDKTQLDSPLLSSWQNTIQFHLGSVAFASLIIAFVKFIHLLVRIMTKGLSRVLAKMFPRWLSCFADLILSCCKKIMEPLERFLIFLNRNAFVEIAIHGEGYLKSARRAFEVIIENVPTLATINSLGDFILLLGKITVTGLTFLCGFFIAKAKLEFEPNLMGSKPIYVVLIVGTIFAFLISHCFLSVYEMAMDTIFVCFCEDLKMNDGVTRPYFMRKKLMKFIQSDKS